MMCLDPILRSIIHLKFLKGNEMKGNNVLVHRLTMLKLLVNYI